MLGMRSAGIVLLNAALAVLVQSAAPRPPVNSDRSHYEEVGRDPSATPCTSSIYCYRVLVPVALEQIPVDPERRWRWYQVIAASLAGSITSALTARVASGLKGPVLAAVLAQTAYGFSFTAYDPYSADPFVFVIAAVLAWCWIEDRWRLASIVATVGVFAKETVALVALACALAALLRRDRPTWRAWVGSAVAVSVMLLGFHWIMDTYLGWDLSRNPAAQFARGSWLAVWWQNNPFLDRKLYLLFTTFGFAWAFAALAFRFVDRRVSDLAVGSIVPFLALCYLQTPERALANAFFVVVPLAAIFLSRAPWPLALCTALANGAVTAKVGSSTAWLPPSRYSMIAASVLACWSVWIALSRDPKYVESSQRAGPTTTDASG